MKRLTERDEFGNADIIGVDSQELQGDLEGREFNQVTMALNKLAAYEDTGLTPERCAELAKAEQEDRLIELPCKIGDKLYTIDVDLKNQRINQRVNIRGVDYIIHDGIELQLCDCGDEVICSADNIIDGTPHYSYFRAYKTFLTLEEAEEALESEVK